MGNGLVAWCCSHGRSRACLRHSSTREKTPNLHSWLRSRISNATIGLAQIATIQFYFKQLLHGLTSFQSINAISRPDRANPKIQSCPNVRRPFGTLFRPKKPHRPDLSRRLPRDMGSNSLNGMKIRWTESFGGLLVIPLD